MVDRGRRAVRRRAAQQPRSACGRRRAPSPGCGRPAVVEPQPDRTPAGSRCVPACRNGPGARLRRREPPRHPGVRACQGVCHRRRVGLRRQRQLQPPLLDSRQRTVVRGARRHAATTGIRATRPGRATTRGCSPGTCACGSCASTWTAPTTVAKTTGCSTRTPRCGRLPRRHGRWSAGMRAGSGGRGPRVGSGRTNPSGSHR